MISKLKKYFILPISLLLVLSNFSFASQQMLCLMNEDGEMDISCSCGHNESNELISGAVISSVSSPCCLNKIIELNNTNNLQVSATELPKDINTFSPSIINIETQNSFNVSNYFPNIFVKDHIPRADIPVLISSLLI